MFVMPGSRLAPSRATILRTQKAIYKPPFMVLNSGSFVAASSQEMHRTFSGASLTKWTAAFWAKMVASSTQYVYWSGGAADFDLRHHPSNFFELIDLGGATYDVQSSTTTTDTTAFHHFCCAVDTSQATAANRVHLYIDGTEVPYGTSTYPSLSASVGFPGSQLCYIGRRQSGASLFFDGLISEFYYIDNQQLTPSSFYSGGKAVKFNGTFGALDVYLNFQSLGADGSGHANNFTNNGVTQSTTVPPF